jgi:hypothetical protein
MARRLLELGAMEMDAPSATVVAVDAPLATAVEAASPMATAQVSPIGEPRRLRTYWPVGDSGHIALQSRLQLLLLA